MAMIDPRRKSPTQITISIGETELRHVSDEKLALYWHVAQANPVSIDDHDAGELAMRIGWEIIRRWLGKVEPPLYHHQQRHYYHRELSRFARFVDGQWQAKDAPDEVHAADPDGVGPYCGAARGRTTLLSRSVTCAACRQRLADAEIEFATAHALMPDGAYLPHCGAPAGSRMALFASGVTCPKCKSHLAAQLAEENSSAGSVHAGDHLVDADEHDPDEPDDSDCLTDTTPTEQPGGMP